MFNLENIEKEQLSQLGGMYAHGGFLFGFNLMKKRKKFHKWVNKHYSHEISEMPDVVRSYFAPDADDEELVSFLEACQEWCLLEAQYRLDPLLPLGEEVVSALAAILDENYWPRAVERDGCCTLVVEDCSSYCRSLILQNAEGFYRLPEGEYMIDTPKVEKMLDKYRIMAELDEETEQLSVSFSDAKVEVECYNCVDGEIFWDDPWEYLQSLARQIIFKSELPGNHCNEQEMELLPLLREVDAVCGALEEEPHYPLLTQMVRRYGYEELESLLTKGNWKSRLRKKKYEPLWREIFEKIRRSQKDYPKKGDGCSNADALRKRVQQFMKQQGYTGTYPDFEKHFDISGVRILNSYGQRYFVFREKNALSMIHCMETCESGDLAIHFLVGTAFLRKNEDVGDIYTCLFAAKGRRMFRIIRDCSLLYELERKPKQLEKLAAIAVKKSQLKKLSKEERSIPHSGPMISKWMEFWLMLLFAGGFFGIFMTLAMMLMSVGVLTLFGEFRQIPSFFASVPWHQILAFSWVGFGASMGITAVLSKGK